MKQNLNNFLFAGIVLLAVLAGGVKQQSPDEIILESKPEATSFSASQKITSLAYINEVILPPNVTAAAVLVKYLSSPLPLLEYNPEQQWPIASITKLMTATVALENFSENELILASANAVATEGGAGNLIVGEKYSLTDILGHLLKVSSNDAAVALAEHHGGENFLTAMNLKASELQMRSTRFFDPSGLSPLNQSTLENLEKLISYIYNRHPKIFSITSEKEGNIHPFSNQENFIGGKTGFIDEANGNLISLFNYQGRPLLIIVLGSEDRYLDTLALYNRFTNQ